MNPEIIFEDEHIVAYNKPSGMLSIPHRFDNSQASLQAIAERRYGKIYVVHRIDKDTSGLILFAKTPEAHRHFSLAFQNRQVEKHYRAICTGIPVKDSGEIEAALMEHPTIKGKMVINKKGKPAHSVYTVLKKWAGYSYIDVQIFTGRMHQIRVHLQSIGTPIVADPLYGSESFLYLSSFKKKFKSSGNYESELPLMGRLALHAYSIRVTHLDGRELQLEAPEPKDFRATIKQLDKWAS